ncbi:MAG TPA: hypothetical protein PKL13_00240 [bacterium]|nr:hypothetical protein [bacterium]
MKKAFYLFLIVLFCFTITGCTKQNKTQEQQDLIQQKQNMGFPESGDGTPNENNEIGERLNESEIDEINKTSDFDDIDKLLSNIDNIDNENDADIKDVDSIEEDFADEE